jgi:hypothetical protein
MLLYFYEYMAGLKINFDKSEVLLTMKNSIKLKYMLIYLIAK